jgi:putative ABC transport system permease protein
MKALLFIFLAQAHYWRRHKLQAALALFGVALGVAVFTAIRLANAGALAVFAEGLEAFGGRATHRVFHPGGDAVPEHWFPRIAMLPQVRSAAPVLTGSARTISPAPLALQVLGIDVLSEVQAGDFGLREQGRAAPGGELERFLRDPSAIAVPESLARELGLAINGPLPVTLEGREVVLRVAGIFPPPPRNAELLARTVVMDVAAFQELFSRFDTLDEIRIVTNEDGYAAVRAMLPKELTVEPFGARAERAERMSRAFRLNLEALGLFALLVAVFLVHGTALFAVAQREQTIAAMRCLGAPPWALLGALALEALCLGAVGGVLGAAAGGWLAGILVRGTNATLFEVILDAQPLPAGVRLDGGAWATALGLGVLASVSGALVPALQGAWVSPLAALRVWRGQHQFGRWMVLWCGGSAVLLSTSVALLLLSGRSILAGLAGATGIAFGGALLCPAVLWLAGRALSKPLHGLLGAPGLLAARSLSRSLSRTGMSTVSLMVTLSLALSIEITVHSFRHTFELWLSQVVTADLYISAAEGKNATFPQGLAERLRAASWIRDVAELKSRRVLMAGREVMVVAVHPDVFARTASLPMLDAVPTEAMAALRRGGAFVSETLAYPLGLRAGDVIAIPGRSGAEAVAVAAVVQNYSAPSGLIYLNVDRFMALFGAVPTRQLGVWLRAGVDAGMVRDAIGRMPEAATLRVTPNAALKREALRIFDRTFAITRLMSGLAFLVAFAAVAGALLALLEERMRLLGYLRAAGISVRALGATLGLEAVLLALVAGVMSWGVGLVMSAILVFAVNRRAFGWTLQFLPAQGSYGELLALAVAAALLGSLYPIWRVTRLSVIATIREE